MDLFCEGKVPVIREMARSLNVSDKGSKLDIINRIKSVLNIEETFLKLFSKMWGGSGGWLGMTCPHGICYGLKWLLRHEGPRDHVDMVMNLAALPNVIVLDMANMMVAHARNRGYNVFQPFEGRVAECTPENIRKAKDGELEIDWPWFPNGAEQDTGDEVERPDGEQLLRNPSTGSSDHYCLFDQFHEKNSVDPADCLRRVSCVNQLAGKTNSETAEQLNNRRNRDNYFTTSLTAHNSVFVERLATHFNNEKTNRLVIVSHSRQFGEQLNRDFKGQLVVGDIIKRSKVQPPNSKRARVDSVETSSQCSASSTIGAVVSSVIEVLDTTTTPSYSSPNSSSSISPVSFSSSITPCASAAVNPSSTICAESVSINNSAPDLGTTSKPDEAEVCGNVRFLKVAGTCVTLWLFPERFGRSATCLNMCNTSTLTALLLGHIWLATEANFPEDGLLHQSWFSSILYATRTGITLSNESADGARTLTLEETTLYLCRSRLISIVLHPATIVRMNDANPSSRLAHHLEEMVGKKAALFIHAKKAVLFLSSNSSLMMVDSHRNGNVGAVIVKGNTNELPQFLKSLESTLGLNEYCYGNFVCFT